MYSRSYNKNAPFAVPQQYGGVAFSRSREDRQTPVGTAVQKPHESYSPQAEKRLYSPQDLPKKEINVHDLSREEHPGAEAVDERKEEVVGEGAHPVKRSSILNLARAAGDDTLLLLALILLLSGSEGAEDTVMLLLLLLIFG